MEVVYHKHFLKHYSKLPLKVQRQFEQRLRIFHQDHLDEQLDNHPLKGKWVGFRSIDITGDYRAVYLPVGNATAKFYAIGTHSQLYH